MTHRTMVASTRLHVPPSSIVMMICSTSPNMAIALRLYSGARYVTEQPGRPTGQFDAAAHRPLC